MARIVWEAAKPTGNHNGTINTSGGQIFIKDGKISGGNFTIDMTSITVLDLEGDDKASLEAHLKGLETESATDFLIRPNILQENLKSHLQLILRSKMVPIL